MTLCPPWHAAARDCFHCIFFPFTAQPLRRAARRMDRRGAMLPLIAFLLPVLGIFLGFAVDLAYMQSTRLELRAASDVAARAAATTLARTDDVDAAIATAKSIASQNMVAGAPLLLNDADIEVGRSTPDATGRWVFSQDGFPPNSVRVNGKRTASSASGPVPLFFSTLVGTGPFQPQQTATGSFLNVDICLVLDRSTSMKLNSDSSENGMYTSDSRFCTAPQANSRWVALDAAVRVFIDELTDTNADEQVALVTYSSALSGYCGTSNQASKIDSQLSTNLSNVTNAMNNYLAGTWNGNTHIEAGMQNGLAVLNNASFARTYSDKVMIVMTDGYENVGSAMNAASLCASDKIVAHTITFGAHADQNKMRSVANATGGRHYHASTPEALRTVFRELAAQLARLTD